MSAIEAIPESAAGARTFAAAPVARQAAAADLAVHGVAKHYGADAPVLRGVSFAIRRGESVSLIGANGSGKSTLFRCCTRLLEPTSGSVHLFGDEVTNLKHGQMRRVRARVGMVFQRHNLVSRLSVLSNVVHGAQARRGGPRVWLQGLAPEAVREEAMACLEQVGLAHLAARRADQLSGGQSQRVAIARALMQRPEILMADEPVASLDPRAGAEIMALFRTLSQGSGLTLFFISHHVDHAVDYADRLLGLKAGELLIDRPTAGLGVKDLQAIYD